MNSNVSHIAGDVGTFKAWMRCFDDVGDLEKIAAALGKRLVRACAQRAVYDGVRRMCLIVDVWTAHDWVERGVCLDHGRVVRRMCTRAAGCVSYSEEVKCGEYVDLLQRFVELDRPETVEDFVRFLNAFYAL